MTRHEILLDLASILSNFNGREYSGPIEETTLFFGDLGMASIDAVVLAETLENRYARKLPFQHFLAGLKQENLEDLPISRLLDFLETSLAAP